MISLPLYRAFFNLSFLLACPSQPPSNPPLPVLCLLPPPHPLCLCLSVPLVFPYIPSPPSPLLALSSVAFHRLCGSEPGEGIGDSALSLQHAGEPRGDVGDQGCESASVCRLRAHPPARVRRAEVFVRLFLNFLLLMQPQEWDVEREGV